MYSTHRDTKGKHKWREFVLQHPMAGGEVATPGISEKGLKIL